MKLDAAKKLADEAARDFLTGPKQGCPLKDTGLMVLVYRQDDQNTIGSTVVAAGDKTETADEHGLARFLPLAPKAYSVGVSTLPDADAVLEKPKPTETVVAEFTCEVLPLEIPVLARPELKLRWKHDGKAVTNAKVALDSGKIDLGTTDGGGATAWKGKNPIKPGSYPWTVELDGGGAVELYDGDTKLDPAKLDVPAGKKTIKLAVRRPSWVKLKVVSTGGDELKDAALKLAWPDDASEKVFKTAKVDTAVLADVKDILAVATPGTCDLLSVTVDGDDDYELVDLTSE